MPSLSAIATIFTIGHSIHEPEAFLRLLRAHSIEVVADVRRYPSSRRMPWFNRGELHALLGEAGLEYRHLPELGGRRTGGWQGYAEHMRTAEFEQGLDALVELAERRRAAMMCAEAAWQRCHRRLVADALAGRRNELLHIGPTALVEPHQASLEV